MIDPKFNKLPADEAGDFEDISESELSPEQRTARQQQRPRPGLSINDTIAGDAKMSVGSRGTDTSGVATGSGAGAGLTSVTPDVGSGSPAPNIVPGARSSGTTPRGTTGVDQSATTRVNAASGREEAGPARMGPGSERAQTGSGLSSEEIGARAYRCWHERGCPEGSPEIDWHRAEEELRRERERENQRTAGASA